VYVWNVLKQTWKKVWILRLLANGSILLRFLFVNMRYQACVCSIHQRCVCSIHQRCVRTDFDRAKIKLTGYFDLSPVILSPVFMHSISRTFRKGVFFWKYLRNWIGIFQGPSFSAVGILHLGTCVTTSGKCWKWTFYSLLWRDSGSSEASPTMCDSSYRLNFDPGKKNEIQHHS
jgi:hypothetical protein